MQQGVQIVAERNDWVRTKDENDDARGEGEGGGNEAFVFREAAKVVG